MKYNFILIILAIAIACTPNQKEEVSQLQENLDPILSPYFLIVAALSNNDFEKSREAAKRLSDAESNNGVELALVRMGTLMSESSSLYNQRSILEQLGMVIPLYIEQSIINDYQIYKFKCVNEYDGKEVVWFSLLKDSHNPFIGDDSNECIELVETIEPVIVK